jgi:hypothetical protein
LIQKIIIGMIFILLVACNSNSIKIKEQQCSIGKDINISVVDSDYFLGNITQMQIYDDTLYMFVL